MRLVTLCRTPDPQVTDFQLKSGRFEPYRRSQIKALILNGLGPFHFSPGGGHDPDCGLKISSGKDPSGASCYYVFWRCGRSVVYALFVMVIGPSGWVEGRGKPGQLRSGLCNRSGWRFGPLARPPEGACWRNDSGSFRGGRFSAKHGAFWVPRGGFSGVWVRFRRRKCLIYNQLRFFGFFVRKCDRCQKLD